MAKRASSPSAGTPTGKKKAKVTSAVVIKKEPVVTPSGKKNVKVEVKVSSSSNSNQSAVTPSIIKASPSNASASKASASKPSASKPSTSKAITSKARTSKPPKPLTAAQLKQKQKEDEEKEAELKKKVFDEELGTFLSIKIQSQIFQLKCSKCPCKRFCQLGRSVLSARKKAQPSPAVVASVTDDKLEQSQHSKWSISR